MKRLICLAACLVLLCMPAHAAGLPDAPLGELMQTYGLNEDNFAVSYFNTATGEYFSYNSDAFFPVGGLWTLPLHMYYYEQESRDAFAPPPEKPDEVFTVDGLTLDECRYHSILLGDEDIALKMRDRLGSFAQYQLLINSKFGGYDENSLPDSFLKENRYSAAFLMNCLRAVSARPEQFRDLMRNYELVQTADGFAGYDGNYTLVHLRSEENGMLVDVGEISAPQPYLLVCFVSEDAGGDEVLANVNALFYGYSNVASSPTEPSRPEHSRSDTDFIVGQANPSDHSAPLRWIAIALAAAAVLAALAGAVVLAVRRHRDRRNGE